MDTKSSTPAKQLTLFGFFTITASMVMAVYEYPSFATSGFSLLFFLLFGGLFWFIPVALCAAEMATIPGWETGGVFTWVSESLGERWGFAAIFYQFFEITVGYIPMLYFVNGSLSYLFDWPGLNVNPHLKLISILIVFWLLTFSQLGGTKYTAKIARTGFIFGIVIPAIILIGLAVAYVVAGNPVHMEVSWNSFFPDFTNINSLVILVSFILSYMGVEASASHANEMANPKKQYPIAIFMLVIIAIVISSAGGLSIATVIPVNEINLSAGVNQTFATLINHYGSGLDWIVRIIAAFIGLGVLAEISAWIVGPSRAMYVAAQKGILPPVFKKVNKHDVPVPLVMFQGVVVTIWAIVLTLGGGGNNMSFMTSMSLTVVIYLMTYFLLFIGYITLVLKRKTTDAQAAYQIPGGVVVKCVVGAIGFLASLFAFIVSFFPPDNIPGGHTGEYETILTVGFIVVLILPFIIYEFRDKKNAVAIDPTRITTENAPEHHFFGHPKARGEFHITPHPDDVMQQDDEPKKVDDSKAVEDKTEASEDKEQK
ncbi:MULTISPECIES: glutamate:gamma-aminobutyrate antiporter [Cetobacterium]|uniref:Glutamate/gamma-aminobutyrate antiporter n=1 Tax=Candidatus Cetobacterium colombiensis TaxID=3073100 RepID=A0ABU4WBR1_9FUSO|nr:glutamate:gamma-aminobutyrate antiporter [Candidatus Cetobacterium colombiensis]MDX8336006.1 glutamate:gamma-aminobutyrate antiporter [Candidatus Cetobacterium colombiensis]